MPVEENIQLMRRWFREVWNEGKTETVHELMSPNGVARGNSTGGADIHGPEEFARFVDNIRAAFSNIDIKVEEAFGTADKVIVRWSAKMTHSGHGLGMPATGKPVLVGGMTLARIVNGKIVEGWDNWDQLGMLEQIGVYTRPEAIPLQKSA
jgi:steroid delta-isomerase-like uncharacterized protein